MRKLVILASSIVILAAIDSSSAAPGTSAVGRPFTMTMTYSETNPGKDSGDLTTGVEGKGTLSMRIAGAALGGVPVATLATGGTYVVRYDIDAAGTYHGVFVVTPKSRALGSLCLSGDILFGRYNPNAGTGFPPTSGSFTSVGGTGLGARLKLTDRYKATKVVGSDNLKLGFAGTVTASAAAPKAPSKTCLAVAKLAR